MTRNKVKNFLYSKFSCHVGGEHVPYTLLPFFFFFFPFEKMPAIWMKSLESISWQRLKPWTINAIQIQFNLKNPWDLVKKNSNVSILQAIRSLKWITSWKENFKTSHFSFHKIALPVKLLSFMTHLLQIRLLHADLLNGYCQKLFWSEWRELKGQPVIFRMSVLPTLMIGLTKIDCHYGKFMSSNKSP